MICKCKYFLMDSDGVRRCTQCGKPANKADTKIEDKVVDVHETKQPRRKRKSRK